jgi:hypothetical protein
VSSQANEDGGFPAAGGITVTFYRATASAHQAEIKTETITSEWRGSDETVAVASHKKEQSSLRAGIGTTLGRLPTASDVAYDRHEVLATLNVRYTTDFGIAVRGLYTPEEVNMPSSPVRKRVKREPRGTNEDDAIVL